MTYNVGVFSKYTDNSTSLVADIISDAGADVVALNELDSCNLRHGVYQAEALADTLGGWNHCFSGSFAFAGGSYGNGVVSVLPVLHSENVLLPVADGAEQRSMAVMETEDYILAATHFDHVGPVAKIKQAEFITDWFMERYADSSKPVFLCGDMNSRPEDPAVLKLHESWTQLSGTDFTCPNPGPYACIDYIFCLKSEKYNVEILDSYVIDADRNPDVALASDHLPVVVRMKIR